MKRHKGIVSVVMPAFNAAVTIADSVRSVMSQSYDAWELIIVNDGSTDGTSAVLNPFLDDARVILLEQPNSGVAAARNAGIRRSSGEFVAFLDADDLWDSGKVAAQVAMFRESSASLGLVHTRYVSFASDPGSCWRKDDDACFGYLCSPERILVYDFIATSTVMVRAEFLDEIGLFDEGLSGTEDWDLWIRFLARYREHKLNDALVKYRENPNGLTGNVARHLDEEWKVLEKHVLSHSSVPHRIRNKAVFYHMMKVMVYCLSKGYLRQLVIFVAKSIASYPFSFCDPSNYWDVMHIAYSRYLLRRW